MAGVPSSASVSRQKPKPIPKTNSVVSGAAGSDGDSVSSSTPLANTAVGAPVTASFDPMLLLASRAAPAFVLSLETRSAYLGRVEGMAFLHAHDTSRSVASGKGFRTLMDSLMRRHIVAATLSCRVRDGGLLLRCNPALAAKRDVLGSRKRIKCLQLECGASDDSDESGSSSDDDASVYYDSASSASDNSSSASSDSGNDSDTMEVAPKSSPPAAAAARSTELLAGKMVSNSFRSGAAVTASVPAVSSRALPPAPPAVRTQSKGSKRPAHIASTIAAASSSSQDATPSAGGSASLVLHPVIAVDLSSEQESTDGGDGLPIALSGHASPVLVRKKFSASFFGAVGLFYAGILRFNKALKFRNSSAAIAASQDALRLASAYLLWVQGQLDAASTCSVSRLRNDTGALRCAIRHSGFWVFVAFVSCSLRRSGTPPCKWRVVLVLCPPSWCCLPANASSLRSSRGCQCATSSPALHWLLSSAGAGSWLRLPTTASRCSPRSVCSMPVTLQPHDSVFWNACQIVAAWNWSVDRKLGLFSGSVHTTTAQGSGGPTPVAPSVEDVAMRSILFRPWESGPAL